MDLLHSYKIIVPVAFILLLLFVLKGTKSNLNLEKEQNKFLSREQTGWLRGIGIVLIMYCHYFSLVNAPFIYTSVGALGVAMFFFMSGYGLMISKIKKPDYNKGFLKNKALRIYAPFFVSFVICCIIMVIAGMGFENNILLDFVLLSLPGSVNWYLKVQLIMYILFWLMSVVFKDNHKFFCLSIFILSIAYMLIGFFTKIDWFWYENTLFFSVGIFTAMYKDKIFATINKRYLLSLAVSVLLLIFGFGTYYFIGGSVYLEMLYIYTFMGVILVLLAKICGNSKILNFLGEYSIELYLSHTIILKLTGFVDGTNILYFVPFILISVLLALPIKYVSNKIVNLANYKPKLKNER